MQVGIAMFVTDYSIDVVSLTWTMGVIGFVGIPFGQKTQTHHFPSVYGPG